MKRYLFFVPSLLLVFFTGTIFSQFVPVMECQDVSQQCIDAPPGSQWFWDDLDHDGLGDYGTGDCIVATSPPYGYADNCSDCDDNNPNVGLHTAWYLDEDGDGKGGNLVTYDCSRPTPEHVTNNSDCDDNDPAIGTARSWYHDYDGDGFGDPNDIQISCNQPSGHVSNNDDCNDNDATTQLNIYYLDADDDTFGDPDEIVAACFSPGEDYVSNSDDCDDENSFINPNTKWYVDADGDGYGDASLGFIQQCEPVLGRAWRFGDCNDSDAGINPATIWYEDSDGDGLGDSEMNSQTGCDQPSGYVMEFAGLDPVRESALPDLSDIDVHDLNVTHTIEPLVEVTSLFALQGLANSQKLETKSYHDGLGRVAQSIAMRQGGIDNDIVTYVEYDRFGRNTKSFLPYGRSSGTSGSFVPDARSKQKEFYYNATIRNAAGFSRSPYNETVYDRSPLNRKQSKGSSGNSWKIGSGNEVSHGYKLNSGFNVRHFKVVLDTDLHPSLIADNYYSKNQLAVSISRDENWVGGVDHTTEEYKNKEGQVILKRGYVDGIRLSTYYVYDDYGNLTYILTPKSEPETNTFTQAILDDLCFQYRYDGLRRQVAKHIPGVHGWEKIVYDREDRPVLVQDPKLALSNQWLFTKYDRFGRVVYTGIHTTTSNQEALQHLLENTTGISANSESEPVFGVIGDGGESLTATIDGVEIGYTNKSYPTSNISLLTVTYYDDYDFFDPDIPAPPSMVFGESFTTNVKGMPVASWSRTIGKDTWSKSYTYYDERGRMLRAYSINHLGGHSYVDTEYDFRGKPLQTVSSHKRIDSSTPIVTTDRYTYDHSERIRTHSQQLSDGRSETILTGHVYDAVGKELVKYIEPEDDSFGYTFGRNSDSSSRTNFNGERMGSWQVDAGASGSADFTRNGLQVSLSQQGDAISGDYDLEAGSEYAISLSIQQEDFVPDLDLVVTYQGTVVHQQHITASGIFTAFVNPTQTGIHRFSVVMSSANTSGVDQNFIMDNAVLEQNRGPVTTVVRLKDINALQQIDYRYNARGFLTKINEVGNLADDAFAYRMEYDKIYGNLPSEYKTQFNGNISQIFWKTRSDNTIRSYGYAYDGLNRLKKAKFNNANFDLTGVNYDKNGNITALSRNLSSGSQQFNYQYDTGNKLMHLGGSEITGVNLSNVDRDYTYDVNGNMISDTGKNVSNITYNYLNLPETVTFTTGEIIEYDYTAGGTKLQKRFTSNGNTTTTDYLGGYQYINDNLEFFIQPEGYIVKNPPSQPVGYRYVYNYTDHLGNVRISYSDLNGNGAISPAEIIRENNYYPFGLLHQGYNDTVHPLASSSTYGFGGKELQEENNIAWIDFGSRNYDAELGRWFNVDPQAERYSSMSPYVGIGNNPIIFTDPNGEELFSAILVGALIGAATSAATYSLTALATDNWNIGDFGKAVGIGALSGAFAAGISSGAAALTNSAIANGGTGAFWQSTSFNILSETASQVGTSLAFGNDITLGTLAGSVAGGAIGSQLPSWKGVKGGYLANAFGEIGFNATKGAIRGAVSGGVGAAVDGGDIGQGIGNGARNGAIGGAASTVALIGTFGATYNPTDEQLKYVNNMASATGISANSATWRKGGLYQVLQPLWSQGYKREVTWGNTVATFRDTDAATFGHEFGHIIQFHRQGWANFQGRGLFEQLFFRGNPYTTPGTNEYDAERLFQIFKN